MNCLRLYKIFFAISTLFCTPSIVYAMEVSQKDHYQALEISRHADRAAIAKAFITLAQKHGHAQRSRRYKEILEAYHVLKDPETKKAYDATLPAPKEVSLTEATDCLEGVSVPAPTQEEADVSEMQLFASFASASESGNNEGWKDFLECYTAHLSHFAEYFSCDHLTLLKKCAALLLSQVAEKRNMPIKQEILKLQPLMAQENKTEILEELQRKITSLKGLMSMHLIIPKQRQNLLLKEIQQKLELFFYQISQSTDAGHHQKVELLNQKLSLLEPGLDLLLPGVLEFKRTFYDFATAIDRTDSLLPREAIVCLQDTFKYLAKRGQNSEEWSYFIALCDVALEKWGRQREMMYLQVLAQALCTGKEVTFLIHLNDDIKLIRKLLEAHRLEEAVRKLLILKTVQENYQRLFSKEMPRVKEVQQLLNLYVSHE